MILPSSYDPNHNFSQQYKSICFPPRPGYQPQLDHVVKQGFTQQPNYRGTIDILWSCLFSLFLCLWSTACLHIPAKDDTTTDVWIRRIQLLIACCFAPELMFIAAYNQWVSAHRSVEYFHASGYTSWTHTHGFFADAGGFVLHIDRIDRTELTEPTDHKHDFVSFPAFPVNSKQLHYLVVRGYVDYPTISKQQIDDRNKRDLLIKVVTISQLVWFVVNVLLRLLNGLHITALELTTLAFISCSVVTALCWLRKPTDVRTPENITSKVSLKTILLQANHDSTTPYYHTPLDFISHEDWLGHGIWAGWINILRRLGIPGMHEARPIQRFRNSMILVSLTGKHAHAMLGVTAVYACIFLTAWNHDFPTPVERLLWRISSLTIFSCVGFIYCVERAYYRWVPALRPWLPPPRRAETVAPTSLPRPARFSPAYVLRRVRNNTFLQDPSLDVPLYVNLPLYLLATIYCSCRAVTTVLDFTELRLLPPDAYTLPNWSSLLPHF